MKRILLAVAIAFSLAVFWFARPEPACAACSAFPCTVSSQCNAGCSCLKTGSDSFGRCVSFN